MWITTIRAPLGEPKEYQLHSGNNTIGRMAGNDIVLQDPSASRYHAKIVYDEAINQVTINDLDSTNGTFVNRDQLTGPYQLKAGDLIRIGQHLLEISYWEEKNISQKAIPYNSHALTRELVLESLDRNAVLIAEVASRLNTILDIPTVVNEISGLMKTTLAADRVEVLLPDQFSKLSESGLATSIARQALEQRSAVMVQDTTNHPAVGNSAFLLRIHAAICVPILSGNDILGLIYVIKNRPSPRPFEQHDLQLAVAIGYQAALTIERVTLLERIRKEELVSRLLRRSIPPQEAQLMLNEYLETGQLPPMRDDTLTILAADISSSTGMAERLGARRFSRILTRYYQEMTDVIFNNSGMIIRYNGDNFIAVFGMAYQPPEPEKRAIQSALDMLECLHKIQLDTGELINLGIGINTGPTVFGFLGSNDFVEFCVVGDTVNTAWVLEGNARPNRILIGDSTYQVVKEHFNILQTDAIEGKAQSEPLQAYEVFPT